MKKNFLRIAAVLAVAGAMLSCENAIETMNEPNAASQRETSKTTRAFGDKEPMIAVLVETNDVNPLNAGDYEMVDLGLEWVDVVELFAANIHKDNNTNLPTLYLNDKLTRVLEPETGSTTTGYYKYVVPLQQQGIKVLLNVLGDWAGIGVANMSATPASGQSVSQQDAFVEILAYAVERYGLDGVGFDDEYANYSGSLVTNSFGSIISKLRTKLPGKLITVFEYGNIGSTQINSTQGAMIDYSYSNFNWDATPDIAGVTNDRYAPLSINLGSTYSSYWLTQFSTWAETAANNNYGAIMFFNLRRTSDVDPLPVFNAVAGGAWGETVVVGSAPANGDRPQDWNFVTGGYTISYGDTQ